MSSDDMYARYKGCPSLEKGMKKLETVWKKMSKKKDVKEVSFTLGEESDEDVQLNGLLKLDAFPDAASTHTGCHISYDHESRKVTLIKKEAIAA